MWMLINGKMVSSQESFEVFNPYTNELVGKAPIASKGQIEEALKSAYFSNHDFNGKERAEILRKIAKKISDNRKNLADLITAELGISIKQALHETERSCNVFRMAANFAEISDSQNLTDFYKTEDKNAELKVISEPLKLVVGITPFNHPLNQVAHKIAPALAAGAPIVVKPSEKTPLTALKLGELIKDIVPKGMVNIITGTPPKEIVDDLITNPYVEMVSFTGGIDAGKYITKKMCDSGKGLIKKVMELGGNSSLTILEDADLDLAARTALGAFDNSGQRCTAIKRIIVQQSVANEFVRKFADLTREIKYGNPLSPDTDMGCVVNEEAAKDMQNKVNQAIARGACLVYGNKREGALYSPTIIDNVIATDKVVAKETFGPVAPIIRVKDVNEAIETINSSNYKLAGAVMTKDQSKAEMIAKETRVGQFSWNGKPGYRTEQAPFGGFGDSGNYEKEGVIEAAKGMKWMRTFYIHKI